VGVLLKLNSSYWRQAKVCGCKQINCSFLGSRCSRSNNWPWKQHHSDRPFGVSPFVTGSQICFGAKGEGRITTTLSDSRIFTMYLRVLMERERAMIHQFSFRPSGLYFTERVTQGHTTCYISRIDNTLCSYFSTALCGILMLIVLFYSVHS
jgi:hypothetical protein